jgi:hypothetical protein
VYGPFFFAKKSVNGFAYLDMLQLWLLLSYRGIVTIPFCNRTEHLPIFIWKIAATSIPLYLSVGFDVRLDVTKTPHLFPGLPGHPTSLHVTFSFGAMLKIKFTCPPLPRDLPELRQTIVAAVDTIDIVMLQRVWQELDYRIDVCRLTRGGHMEYP